MKMNYKEMAEVFNALSDETRLKALRYLAQSPAKGRCVMEVIKICNISQPCMSHHLSVLKHAGLIDRVKDKARCYCLVNRKRLAEVLKDLLGSCCE